MFMLYIQLCPNSWNVMFIEEIAQCLEPDDSYLHANLTTVTEVLGEGSPPQPYLFHKMCNFSNNT